MKNKWIEVVTKFFYVLVILISSLSGMSFSYAEEHPLTQIQFKDLKNFSTIEGKKIEIKGFLNKSPEGKFILSNEPGLKTCCIESKPNLILVKGGVENLDFRYPIVIQGILTLNLEERQKNKETFPIYQIVATSLKQSSTIRISENLLFIVLGLVGFGVFLAINSRRS